VLGIRGNDLTNGDLDGRVTILDKDNKLVAQLGDGGDAKNAVPTRFLPTNG